MATKKTTETQNNNEASENKRSYTWRGKTSKTEPQNDPDLKDIEYQTGMRYNQDTHQRKTMMRWVIILISIWLLVVLVYMGLKGASIFEFETTEIVTLLTTTTANVMALGYIVLKGLFGDVSLNK
ncbi:MAG: AEC family transporter [Bacteroidales bacterium]|nr:AEC family transporter [Bacteroidales bacterium]